MGTWKGFDNSACVEQRITNACFPCRAHASNYIPESPKQIHTQNHFEFQQEGSWKKVRMNRNLNTLGMGTLSTLQAKESITLHVFQADAF